MIFLRSKALGRRSLQDASETHDKVFSRRGGCSLRSVVLGLCLIVVIAGMGSSALGSVFSSFSSEEASQSHGEQDIERFVNDVRNLWRELPQSAQTNEKFSQILQICWSDMSEKFCDTEFAKELFSIFAKKCFDVQVFFVSPDRIAVDWNKDHHGELQRSVFSLRAVQGVGEEIEKAWASLEDSIHLFQVASQYNGTESPIRRLAPVGQAMRATDYDYTQGPAAQRKNPMQFEAVHCCLAHGGFNMLDKVLLNTSTLDSKSIVYAGYLEVDSSNIEATAEGFATRYDEMVCPCFGLRNPDQEMMVLGGNTDLNVYLMLQAAPNFRNYWKGGVSTREHQAMDNLQKIVAFANYSSIFKQALELSKLLSQKMKPIIVHLTAVGGGVFCNKEENILWGLKQAALEYQEPLERAGIEVWLDSFLGIDAVARIGVRLGLNMIEIPL